MNCNWFGCAIGSTSIVRYNDYLLCLSLERFVILLPCYLLMEYNRCAGSRVQEDRYDGPFWLSDSDLLCV